MDHPQRPVLLAIGGHDPSGGAGIQADCEAAAAAGVHCCTALTCITVQNTCGVRQLIPQESAQLRAQCAAILEDSPVAALKIGLIGDARLIPVLAELAAAHDTLPLVVDPVLAAGSGARLGDAALLNQLRRQLLSHCHLLTPNLPEACLLAQESHGERAAQRLLDQGCRAVLITGSHDDTPEVINRLYTADGRRHSWTWPRLRATFHGSGCTLASAIAARLACGWGLLEAVAAAQEYVAATLAQAYRSGRCQLTPQRYPTQAETISGAPDSQPASDQTAPADN